MPEFLKRLFRTGEQKASPKKSTGLCRDETHGRENGQSVCIEKRCAVQI